MNFSEAINTTEGMVLNVTELGNQTTMSPAPWQPATDPPIGYYGETRIILWKTLAPIIMLFGCLGNSLTILVLLRQWKTFSTTSMYLMTLALSDTVVLLTGPLRNWVKYIWDVDFRLMSDAGCKVSLYITFSSIQFSSWLLVAVTVERAASVLIPHKVKFGCTKRVAGCIILAIFIAIYGFNILNLVMNHYNPAIDRRCIRKEEFQHFIDDVYPVLDFVIYFVIPFAVLLICNIIIIVYLEKARRRRKTMTESQGSLKVQLPRNDKLSVYVLMVSLCFIFFLTMTPSGVYQMYYPKRYAQIVEFSKTDPYQAWEDYQYLLMEHTIVNLVMYLNASLNFILYVFSGTKFRKELIAMFSCQSTTMREIFGYHGTDDSSNRSKTKSTSLSTSKQSKMCNNDKEPYAGMIVIIVDLPFENNLGDLLRSASDIIRRESSSYMDSAVNFYYMEFGSCGNIV